MKSVLLLLFGILSVTLYGQEVDNVVDGSGEDSQNFVQSILLESALNGRIDDIDKAIEAGESIDLTNAGGWSAAMFAVANGDWNLLRALIDRGIDLNNPDSTGRTPLMLAASQSDKEMVEILLAGNANPLQVDNDGRTAYDSATDAGRKIVALLIAEASVLHGIESANIDAILGNLEHGAYVNIRNGAGWTPLIFSSAMGNLDAVNKILDLGADVNRIENDGWTALHFAAQSNHREVVATLLAHGANTNARNNEGRSAREIAEAEQFLEIVDMIPAPQEEL